MKGCEQTVHGYFKSSANRASISPTLILRRHLNPLSRSLNPNSCRFKIEPEVTRNKVDSC